MAKSEYHCVRQDKGAVRTENQLKVRCFSTIREADAENERMSRAEETSFGVRPPSSCELYWSLYQYSFHTGFIVDLPEGWSFINELPEFGPFGSMVPFEDASILCVYGQTVISQEIRVTILA